MTKPRMIGWTVAGLLAGAAGAPAGIGYLVLDGPPPLRFQLPRGSPGSDPPLPPLALGGPADPTGASAAASAATGGAALDPGATAPSPATAPGTDSSSASIVSGNPVDATASGMGSAFTSSPAPGTGPPVPFVTPQLLVGLLSGGGTGTNGTAATGSGNVQPMIVAPVGFVPPQPSVGGSSRATYLRVP